jgi:beta-galactosidase GanA
MLGVAASMQAQVSALPVLSRDGQRTQLIVDGQPFIMLGGEARNSSASNPEDLESVYQALDAIHANTAEIPLSWNLLEPEPGKFNFQLVDAALYGARKHNLKVVFLWFGTAKNATFSYVPDWIKSNPKTYFRAQDASGREMDAISPFCDAALNEDKRAFSAVMRHIREFDQRDHTVILMQVENETGLIRTDRDYSATATKAYDAQPPSDLLKYVELHKDGLTPVLQNAWKQSGYRTTGSWTEIFGDLAPEVFSAWSVSRYVEQVAAAGKAEYPIPYYVNVALMNTGSARPGDWPSGGATAHVIDVWKAVAKHIDIIAPDIYRVDFPQQAALYNRSDNVLFVPETGFSPYYAPYVFTVLAGMDGIGFSPFGIDHGRLADTDRSELKAKEGELTAGAVAIEENYRVLRPLLPIIARNRYRGTLFPVVLDMYRHESLAIPLGDSLTAVVHFDEKFVAETQAHRSGGIILKLAADKFIVAGEGFHINFAELRGVARDSEYLSIEEGTFVGEKWVTERVLNGDEENTTLLLRHPRILQVRLNRTLQ